MANNTAVINIKNHSKIMYDLLEKLNEITEVLDWFKEFCASLTETIVLVRQFNKEMQLDSYSKNSLLLYLLQLITILGHLITTFVKEFELNQHIYESRNFTKKQIINCLNGVIEVVTLQKTSLVQPNNFIILMDLALDSIEKIHRSNDGHHLRYFYESKRLVEDVLSHAMSIAQVALSEDCKIIRGASQMVLDALDSLFEKIQKHDFNQTVVKLYSDLCSDQLCSLEIKLNTAVLKLSLTVFSEYTDHLEAIATFCLNKDNANKMDELDALVADFDLHVDRIMQIGLFAISCSSNTNDSIRIKSCLASLEALEMELVPAFTAALVNPTNQNIGHIFLLKIHWLQQANILKTYIFHIIEPSAFCKVIYEEVKQYVEEMSNAIRSENFIEITKPAQKLIKASSVMKSFLSTNQEEFSNDSSQSIFNNFLKVHHEVKTAADVLLEEHCLQSTAKVLKRCKILMCQIKTLYCFLEKNSDSEKSNVDLQLSTVECKKSEILTVGIPLIDHIINQGKHILQDRSILYKTPTKSKIVYKENSIPSTLPTKPRTLILRKMCFLNEVAKKECSLDLHITGIN